MLLKKIKALLIIAGLFLFIPIASSCEFYQLSSGGIKINCESRSQSFVSEKHKILESKIFSQVDQLTNKLGPVTILPVSIYILPTNYFPENKKAKVNGYFNLGRIFLKSSKKGTLDFSAKSLFHELVHLAVYRLSAGSAPTWIDEGLAQYLTEANQVKMVKHDPNCKIQDYTGSPLSLCNPEAFYSMSKNSVAKLVHIFGIRKIVEFLQIFPLKNDFQLTFKHYFGNSLSKEFLFSKHSFHKNSYL